MTTTNPARGERVSVHDVLRAANKLAGVDLTRRFSGEHKEARFKHAAFLAARHLTGASYSIIARVFGGMDHTSVLHGVKRACPELAGVVAAAARARYAARQIEQTPLFGGALDRDEQPAQFLALNDSSALRELDRMVEESNG